MFLSNVIFYENLKCVLDINISRSEVHKVNIINSIRAALNIDIAECGWDQILSLFNRKCFDNSI